MSNKILVAYATHRGSTKSVAEFIGETLQNEDLAVDVRPAKKVKDIGDYRAVILGSGIMAGSWYGDATKFLKMYQDALKQIPVAYFVVCLTLKEDTEKHRQEVAAYLDPVKETYPQIEPVDVGLFGGALDYEKLGFIKKMIMKKMEAPEGDFRNWEAIRIWTEKLLPLLPPSKP